jgi:hypothetical protein
MIKKSTQLEIDDFIKKFGTDDERYSTYTKQSFSEARQKLSPEAFNILNNEFIQKYYEDNEFKKYIGTCAGKCIIINSYGWLVRFKPC